MFHFSEDDAMGSDGATSLALVPFDAVPVPPAAGSLADGAHCLQIVALPSLPRSTGEAADAGSKKKSQKDKVKDKETKPRKRSLKLRSTTKKLKGRTVKHAKSKPKPKSRSARGTTHKRKRAVAILKEAPAEDILQETPVVESFRWPHHLMEKVLSRDGRDHLRPLHVQVFSEFSGAGTAESSLQAIASAAPDTVLQCYSP